LEKGALDQVIAFMNDNVAMEKFGGRGGAMKTIRSYEGLQLFLSPNECETTLKECETFMASNNGQYPTQKISGTKESRLYQSLNKLETRGPLNIRERITRLKEDSKANAKMGEPTVELDGWYIHKKEKQKYYTFDQRVEMYMRFTTKYGAKPSLALGFPQEKELHEWYSRWVREWNKAQNTTVTNKQERARLEKIGQLPKYKRTRTEKWRASMNQNKEGKEECFP